MHIKEYTIKMERGLAYKERETTSENDGSLKQRETSQEPIQNKDIHELFEKIRGSTNEAYILKEFEYYRLHPEKSKSITV